MRNLLFLLLFSLLFSANAIAKENIEIAAVVGGKAISTLDVQNRVKMAVASSGMAADKDTNEKLFHQALQVLIDENLYAQDAERLGIKASDYDLQNAIKGLETRNNIKPGTFRSFVQSKGISPETVIEQLKAQILWSKIVSSRIAPRIVVTDREVNEKMEHIGRGAGKSEFDISEIILPVDRAKDDKKVKALAEKLVKKIREGAHFNSVAKEFSRSQTEDNNKVRWIAEETMPEGMAVVVRGLKSEEISEPFLSEGAYHIVKLNDRRLLVAGNDEGVSVGIKQAYVPFKAGETNDEKQTAINELNQKKQSLKKCDDFTSFAKEINSQVNPQLINSQVGSLNPEIRNVIAKTKAGSSSDVLVSESGLYVFMVCSKSEAKQQVVLDMQIKEMLMKRKIDLQAQRYTANLRRNTLIELR